MNKLLIAIKTMTPTIISVAALFVAYNSYLISENQLSVSKVSVEPHFYVDEESIYDEKLQKVVERELKIFNIGAPVANINTSVRSFYKVKDNGVLGEKWMPLTGYYFASFRTGEPKGKITTYKGYKNALKNFNTTFIAFRNENEDYIDIELKHFVFISYHNFKGEKNNICFLDRSLIECSLV